MTLTERREARIAGRAQKASCPRCDGVIARYHAWAYDLVKENAKLKERVNVLTVLLGPDIRSSVSGGDSSRLDVERNEQIDANQQFPY